MNGNSACNIGVRGMIKCMFTRESNMGVKAVSVGIILMETLPVLWVLILSTPYRVTRVWRCHKLGVEGWWRIRGRNTSWRISAHHQLAHY